ncbi:MAG TPA: GH116 family glycosyl-hydrolase [Bacillota bacterium]|nr:GH116 family glycosyl-hydrolase [Bacillota bacterium]
MKTYRGEYLREIVFPLSGIGTGGIGISGIGALVDWELTGRANKFSVNEYTHFAIKAERSGKVLDARVLHGDLTKDLMGVPYAAHHHSWGYGHGPNRTTLAGIPHFSDVAFRGFFPFANITYSAEKMPADIELLAFNPFIPGDEDNSSLPAAFFEWNIKNTFSEETDYTLAFSVGNPFRTSDGGFDKFLSDGSTSSILLSSKNYTPEQPEYGELLVSTNWLDVSYQEYWYRSGWFDDLVTFWREFSSPGKLKNRHYDNNNLNGKIDTGDMATLAAHVRLMPGESKKIRFLLTWYFPNFVKYWDNQRPVWKHEYCRRFNSAIDVQRYCFENWDTLYCESMKFSNALFGSSLPPECVDAAASNLAVLKSATCLRLENGEFWAFEGTNANSGSCEGTCDHVWQYQYSLPFLFPRLARNILEINYEYNVKESGEMMFRTMLPLGSGKWNFRACVDGQMGSILRFYREWKLSGDDAWLRKYWGTVKKTLEYAWSPDNRDLWDPDKSGVLTGRQHHTLDVELFGSSSWLTGFYLAALAACAEIADYLGEHDKAEEYRVILEKGKKHVENELYNGRYYIQKIDVSNKSLLDRFAEYDPSIYSYYWNSEKNEIKYQYGCGCEIDQLVAQWHATLIGIGDIFDKNHRKTAARSLYEINFKSMREVFNPCRVFALNDERGVVICEWPQGEYKPQIPIPYAEECMTGFEYAAAGLMIQEGLVDEGTEVVRAIRDRYDGKKRNPYSEIECGASYARSMASFALLAAFSGFRFDMTKGEIGFDPVTKERPFMCFWSVDGAWGTVQIGIDKIVLTVLKGKLNLNAFILPGGFAAKAAYNSGEKAPFDIEGGKIMFVSPVCVYDTLCIEA